MADECKPLKDDSLECLMKYLDERRRAESLEIIEKMRHVDTATEFLELDVSVDITKFLHGMEKDDLWMDALQNICLARWNEDFKVAMHFGHAVITLPTIATLFDGGGTVLSACWHAMYHIAEIERERDTKCGGSAMTKSAAKK